MVRRMIEKELVGKLIYEPELIKTCRAKTEWITDPHIRDVLDVLIENYGKAISSNGIYEEVRAKRPNSPLTVEQVEDMRMDGMVADDMDGLTDILEERYFRQKVTETSRTYSDYPSNDNLILMQDAIREYDDLDQEVNDGTLESLHERFVKEMHTDTSGGITSYPLLDQVLAGGMFGGDFFVIGARPGVGKTAYGINLGIQATVKNDDVAVDFFTLEMPAITMYKRFMTRISEINGMRLRNPYRTLRPDEKVEMELKSKEFMKENIRVFGDADVSTLDDLLIMIRRRHHEEKIKGNKYLPIIDYLQLIEVGGYSESKNIEVGKITRRMKLLCNELEIPIVLLSQLNREMKADERPSLSNLRDSGNIEQDASHVMFLFEEVEKEAGGHGYSRDQSTNKIINYVAKNRHGVTGDIFYRFLKSKMYFQELDE